MLGFRNILWKVFGGGMAYMKIQFDVKDKKVFSTSYDSAEMVWRREWISDRTNVGISSELRDELGGKSLVVALVAIYSS